MTAKILYHPRIFMGCAAELERLRGHWHHGPVRCADCRHAVPYDRHPQVCYCLCYKTERSALSPRECPHFEARA